MSKFAAPILKASSTFLAIVTNQEDLQIALAKDTKLIQIIVFIFQSMQILVESDPVSLGKYVE